MKKSYDSQHGLPLKSRSRQELADAYGVSLSTFRRWLKLYQINLPPGLVKPVDVQKIYNCFGRPEG